MKVKHTKVVEIPAEKLSQILGLAGVVTEISVHRKDRDYRGEGGTISKIVVTIVDESTIKG